MKTLVKLATALALTLGPGHVLAQRPLGVDVSSYQGGSIDWSSVKSSGWSFAWAKATGGTGIIDGDFTKNENNGKAAGVYMGAYHFAYPDLNPPGAEASYFWTEAGGYIKNDGKTLMPMLDMEEFSGLDGASSYTAWANDWCADVVADAAGNGVAIHPMLYCSACAAGNFNSSITGFPWIADYNSENPQSGTPWSTCSGDDVWGSGVWDMWQYSSSGSVSGISGSVDEDVFNGTLDQMVSALVVGKRWTYGDYDGDGKADPALWEPGNGYWYIQGSKGTSWDTQWGLTGDIPVPADYDGDGITDLAVFRPSNGTWYIHGSKGTDWTVQFGKTGDIPVPGDYDGDGLADFVVFRPSTGTWWFDCTTKGVSTNSWGANGDIPVARDYDGDGITDPAVWRPSNGYWYIMGSTGTNWDVQWGTNGDIPVPGDYDGDGKADYVLYRPSDNLWYLNCSTAGAFTKTYGYNTDIAQSADYDGDGITDIAIWRPSDLYWYIMGSEGTNWSTDWGQNYMQPVNLPSAIYDVFYLAPSITTQPSDQIVTQGENATFSVVAAGAAPLSYQWSFNSANISAATASSFTVTNAQSANAGSYTVEVTNRSGSVTSTVATLTVNTGGTAPTITTQPASQMVNQGEGAVFSVTATGTAPLSYQWKFNSSSISGATASSYALTNAQGANAGSYTVVVTNTAGSVTSSIATLTVIIPPSITTQPANVAVVQGSNATFNVVATGTAPLSYQWAFNGGNISGATGSSYTLTNAQSDNAGNYSVAVTNLGGSLTSSNAVLTVNIPPSITTQPASQAVDQGSNATFSVLAAGTSPFGYQWTFDGGNISGATASSYTVSDAQTANAGSYAVVVTNAAGAVTSSTATLTVDVPPSITTQPSNKTVNEGQNATFGVVANGTAPLSYQWTFNSANISGATASSYTVSNVQSGDAGSYAAFVTNAAGTVTSSTATLTMNLTNGNTMDVFAQGSPSGSGVDHITWSSSGTGGWDNWQNMGPVGTGKPAVCSYLSGYLNVFARGTNNALWTKYYYPAGGWSTWASLGGNMASDPCAVVWRGGTNYIFVFYQGTNNQIVERYWNSISGWNSGEVSQGGTPIAGGAPAACSYEYGYLNLFIRSTNNALLTTYYSPSGWQGAWTSLGGTLTSDPGATSWGMQRIDVFAQGSPAGSSVNHIDWTTSGWSSWSSLGAVGTGAPAVCSYASNYLNIFATGTNNALWTKYYAPAGWSTNWTSLGGTLTSDPCCVSWTTGN